MGFVNTTINNIDSLNDYNDGYLDIPTNLGIFYDFQKWGHEIISMKISLHNAQQEFNKVKDKLLQTIKSEL